MKKIILFLTSSLLIVLGGRYLISSNRNIENDNQNITEMNINGTKKPILCKRDTPYKTNPEFERGLSLLYQRIEEHKNDSTVQEELKPTIDTLLQIRNCLNIQYSESDDEDAEGFFVFDPDSTAENLQIFVNKKYASYDDALTALLLVHEVTHAVQFVNFKTNNEVVSCVDKEIESIRMEYRLLRSFTYAENTSIKSRITYENERGINLPTSLQEKRMKSSGLNGVIQLIDIQDKILDICTSENNRKSSNNWINIFECAGERETKYIREYILDNPFYKEQCNL